MWDCIIVGGGPAGLTAATYLGRFKRQTLIVDAGHSRLKRVPLSRNVPGFPEGIEGPALYTRLEQQALRYGARLYAGCVDEIAGEAEGFVLRVGEKRERARSVLLATGVKMIDPECAGLEAGMHAGRIRYCPVCDGYEASGKSIAVLGGRAGAIHEAHFLRTYSDDVTFAWLPDGAPTSEETAQAKAAGITLVAAASAPIEIEDGVILCDTRGAVHRFDILYPSLGCHPRATLAVALGARVSETGGLLVDAHQQTSVTGLYAAGDVLEGLDQIASACGQAAIAAVAIHNALAALADRGAVE